MTKMKKIKRMLWYAWYPIWFAVLAPAFGFLMLTEWLERDACKQNRWT